MSLFYELIYISLLIQANLYKPILQANNLSEANIDLLK